MKRLMQGNEAIAEAAVKAGLKFFAGYPITPASEIMQALAKEKNLCFMHVEDEIAAINMIIGASLGGAKAMTATSGPGFSLMQEGIGLAHVTQTPVVVVDVQRVGPSTGMPTMASQGDILQAKHGSHGDYFPLVFYPSSVEECYSYTLEAFNAAEESMSPVILLSDAFVSRLYESFDSEKINVKILERKRKPIGSNARHFTGLLSKDGVPKTRDSVYYRQWLKELKGKIGECAKKYAFYEYLENKKSSTLLIAYGITARVVMPLKSKCSIFKPIRIFPVLEEELKKIAKKYKRIVVVEMNAGQYKEEVERVLQRKIELISLPGGSISLSEIEAALK